MCKQRFLKSIIASSKTEQVILPWAKKRLSETVEVTLKPALPMRKTA